MTRYMCKFDSYASLYDEWFVRNRVVFETELKLVDAVLRNAGRVLTVGCGTALFESMLCDKVDFVRCIEPSEPMADIARKRGFEVEIATAEDAHYGSLLYDTVLFNGCPCYMTDFGEALRHAYESLCPGGRVVAVDVPKESPFGCLYNLAMTLGTWQHPLIVDVAPVDPYPIELVRQAVWRTNDELSREIEGAGFSELEYMETLTASPCYAHLVVEEPQKGYTHGSYVAITGYKKI